MSPTRVSRGGVVGGVAGGVVGGTGPVTQQAPKNVAAFAIQKDILSQPAPHLSEVFDSPIADAARSLACTKSASDGTDTCSTSLPSSPFQERTTKSCKR